METERIALSQRERDRLRVLHEIKQKQITQREAAKRLPPFAGERANHIYNSHLGLLRSEHC
jgi:hypothetical protein